MSCDHGITLASYVERCAECGAEVVHRPPKEAALRVELERYREALRGLVDMARGTDAMFPYSVRRAAERALTQDSEHP